MKLWPWKKINHDIFTIEVKEEDMSLNLMHFIRLCYKYALRARDGLSTCQVSNINIFHQNTLIVIITGDFTPDNSCYLMRLEYEMFKEKKPGIHAVLMPS